MDNMKDFIGRSIYKGEGPSDTLASQKVTTRSSLPLPSIKDMDINKTDIYKRVIDTRIEIGDIRKRSSFQRDWQKLGFQEIKKMQHGLNASIGNAQENQNELLMLESSRQLSLKRGNSTPHGVTALSFSGTTRQNLQHILEASNNVLGAGGFGTVRYGVMNGQKVAVKVLKKHTQEGNVIEKYFNKES